MTMAEAVESLDWMTQENSKAIIYLEHHAILTNLGENVKDHMKVLEESITGKVRHMKQKHHTRWQIDTCSTWTLPCKPWESRKSSKKGKWCCIDEDDFFLPERHKYTILPVKNSRSIMPQKSHDQYESKRSRL